VKSRRLASLPPYLLGELAARAAELRRQGHDVINISIGSPDLPPDPRVIEATRTALGDPRLHGYALGRGLPAFRRAAADYLARRFGVTLDPDRQVLALLGSKEGLGHLPIALGDGGDLAVHPDPGYPVYRPALLLAGLTPVALPHDSARGWAPRWDLLEESLARAGRESGAGRLRLVILNYPHNPTSATLDLAGFDQAVRWARSRGAVLVNDNAYADIGFDGYRPPSLLQAPEAAQGAAGSGVVEFHSMSKTFSMAGWRCAFAAGDPEVLDALARVKNFYDTGIFAPLQVGAARALELAEEIAPQVSARYRARRDVLRAALAPLGLQARIPEATIYLWARLPEAAGEDAAWCGRVLEETFVALSQGSAYGEWGRGYVRFALTEPEERLMEVVRRLEELAGRGA
jgi:LL-diaminopimelate aminotransferase